MNVLYLFVGGALPDTIVQKHYVCSAAAAQWQLNFAKALALEKRANVICLSYVPVARDERCQDTYLVEENGVIIRSISRKLTFIGSLTYVWNILRHIVSIDGRPVCVFCYNPLLWTATFAYFAGMWWRSPVITIVAELEDNNKNEISCTLRRLLENMLSYIGNSFIALSPGIASRLPANSAIRIFCGLADQKALRAPQTKYLGRIRFVYAGALKEEVGARDFLEAAKILLGKGADCEFHLFGRGPLLSLAYACASERFTVHGFVSEAELYNFLGQDAVGVNPRPSRFRLNRYNVPYKVITYLSRGVVTITTVTAGLPSELSEVCIPASEGADGLVHAMQQVLNMSKNELEVFSQIGRERIKQTGSPIALGKIVSSLLNRPS